MKAVRPSYPRLSTAERHLLGAATQARTSAQAAWEGWRTGNRIEAAEPKAQALFGMVYANLLYQDLGNEGLQQATECGADENTTRSAGNDGGNSRSALVYPWPQAHLDSLSKLRLTSPSIRPYTFHPIQGQRFARNRQRISLRRIRAITTNFRLAIHRICRLMRLIVVRRKSSRGAHQPT